MALVEGEEKNLLPLSANRTRLLSPLPKLVSSLNYPRSPCPKVIVLKFRLVRAYIHKDILLNILKT